MHKSNGSLNVLKDMIALLWSSEIMITEAMPKLCAHSENEGLKISLAAHLNETIQHKNRIAAIAKQLDFDLHDVFNPEMKEILESGKKRIEENPFSDLIDINLIHGAIEVVQYEIAGYKKAAAEAKRLGFDEIYFQLNSILGEEQQSLAKLNFLAKGVMRMAS